MGKIFNSLGFLLVLMLVSMFLAAGALVVRFDANSGGRITLAALGGFFDRGREQSEVEAQRLNGQPVRAPLPQGD